VKHIEDAHQAQLVSWAKLRRLPGSIAQGKKVGDFLIAIPNGGKRDIREAARLKQQGVKSGVSDLFLALPRGNYCGLWIEMKRPIVKGKSRPKVSEMQNIWISKMVVVGYRAKVCYGFDEARELIEMYLKS